MEPARHAGVEIGAFAVALEPSGKTLRAGDVAVGFPHLLDLFREPHLALLEV